MEAVEATLAVYIVRFGLVIAALGLGIACWLRQTRFEATVLQRIIHSEQLRADVPADTAAKLAGLGHQVLELDETFKLHLAKSSARETRSGRKQQAVIEAEPVEVVPPTSAELEAQLGPQGVKRLLNAAAQDAGAAHRTRRGGDGRG